MPDPLVVLSAKVPRAVAEAVYERAERRLLSVSALLRALVDAELAADSGEAPGAVEAATRVQIERAGWRGSEARCAAALNMARRLDHDPTAAAATSAELRRLLDDLVAPPGAAEFGSVEFARWSTALRRLGFGVVHLETGRRFSMANDLPPGGFADVFDHGTATSSNSATSDRQPDSGGRSITDD